MISRRSGRQHTGLGGILLHSGVRRATTGSVGAILPSTRCQVPGASAAHWTPSTVRAPDPLSSASASSNSVLETSKAT